MIRNVLGTLGLVVAAVLVISLNIASNTQLTASRLDLTENQVYTLTDGTREVLGNLAEPITLRLYLSRQVALSIPSINSYADRVENLLREYSRASNGQIRLQVIDPEPFSEQEDRAVGYGLSGVPVSAGGDTLYFGLVGTSSTDDEQVIPFFSDARETLLEYDLSKLIYSLANPELPDVGLLSTLPVEGAGPQAALRGLNSPPWAIVGQMRELFEVRSLDPAITEIPADIEILMLVHPRALPKPALYAIDQFVMRGGRLLAFLDPNAESQPPQAPNGMPLPPGARSSELGTLLDGWGVKFDNASIVADLSLAVKVRQDLSGRVVTFDYPVWMNLPQQLLAEGDVLTAQLGNMAFGTAGALEPAEGASSTFTPLVSTTDKAATFPASAVGVGSDPQALVRDYKPAGKPFVLAARVTGKMSSAFPDGAPAADDAPGSEAKADDGTAPDGDEGKAQHIASLDDGNVILIADTDMLQDRFWVQVQDFLGSRMAVPTASNGSFVINVLDNLAGSNALISVRNRGSSNRPFAKIEELRLAAEARFREKEQELETRLGNTERELLALEEAKQGGGRSSTGVLVLSDAQRAMLDDFTNQRLQIRKDLRAVRLDLRRDIEQVGSWIKFANIGAIPILIAVVGLLSGLFQMRRRRSARPA